MFLFLSLSRLETVTAVQMSSSWDVGEETCYPVSPNLLAGKQPLPYGPGLGFLAFTQAAGLPLMVSVGLWGTELDQGVSAGAPLGQLTWLLPVMIFFTERS